MKLPSAVLLLPRLRCAVLSIAARHVESEGVQGSCTACLLTINKESGKLQSATLGDSGFLIVGRGPQSSVNAEWEVSARGQRDSPACVLVAVLCMMR
jgi:hypothetical protein